MSAEVIVINNSRQINEQMDEKIKDALMEIGLFVEGQAKLLSPVDTGNLRGSIGHRVYEEENAVRIGTDVDYAIYVEKGTRYMHEQPYLTPAVENNIDEIKQITDKHLSEVGGR